MGGGGGGRGVGRGHGGGGETGGRGRGGGGGRGGGEEYQGDGKDNTKQSNVKEERKTGKAVWRDGEERGEDYRYEGNEEERNSFFIQS